METLDYVMSLILSKHQIFRSIAFACSIYCLRQSVRCLLQLHHSASPIFKKTKNLKISLRFFLYGATIFVTFIQGKEIKERGRANTFKNELNYVKAFYGLEQSAGIYRHDELLDSNKASVWVSLCMTSALYSFLLTLSNLQGFPLWSKITTTSICLFGSIHAFAVLIGFVSSFYLIFWRNRNI